MLLQGRREEALPLLLKGFDAFRATGAEVRVPSYLGMLGDAYTQSARFEDAHQALDEGLAVAEKNDDRCHEAELHRLKGELLLAESPDQTAAAEDCFRRAIETARRQQSKGWELRATMSLARLWQRQGRRGDAHAALAAVSRHLHGRVHDAGPRGGRGAAGSSGLRSIAAQGSALAPTFVTDRTGQAPGASDTESDRIVSDRKDRPGIEDSRCNMAEIDVVHRGLGMNSCILNA